MDENNVDKVFNKFIDALEKQQQAIEILHAQNIELIDRVRVLEEVNERLIESQPAYMKKEIAKLMK